MTQYVHVYILIFSLCVLTITAGFKRFSFSISAQDHTTQNIHTHPGL
jgi:hypothetical protein